MKNAVLFAVAFIGGLVAAIAVFGGTQNNLLAGATFLLPLVAWAQKIELI